VFCFSLQPSTKTFLIPWNKRDIIITIYM
jgi:hypothetical protein